MHACQLLPKTSKLICTQIENTFNIQYIMYEISMYINEESPYFFPPHMLKIILLPKISFFLDNSFIQLQIDRLLFQNKISISHILSVMNMLDLQFLLLMKEIFLNYVLILNSIRNTCKLLIAQFPYAKRTTFLKKIFIS